MTQLSSTLDRAAHKTTPSSNSELLALASDPVTVFLMTVIRSKNAQHLSDLLGKIPGDLHPLTHKLIEQLENSGYLELDTLGVLKLKSDEHINIHDTEALAKFLPSLNRTATNIAIRKAKASQKGNSYRFIAVPRNAANLKRIKEITDRFYAELIALSTSDRGESEDGTSVQFVSAVNTEIKLEDLV